MGSVLGTMLWKTSKSEEVIQTFIETGTLNQFLNLANIEIQSFHKTYKDELPVPESYEHKFIFSIFGIYVNIVAQKVGRDFVLERENGHTFINSTLAYLGEISLPSGQLLKRLMLMMLFNISITTRGAMLIQKSDIAVENILKCQDQNHSCEIQSLSLTLMVTLLTKIHFSEFYDKIMNAVSYLSFFWRKQNCFILNLLNVDFTA